MSDKYPTEAGIYKLTSIITEKIYIGKAVNLRRRLNEHKNCRTSSNDKFHLKNAIIKYGWDSFKVEILEIFENFDKLDDNDKLLERESFYIELNNSTDKTKGYNICKFSRDRTGIPLSDEHKLKIRNSLLGKPLSEERKKRISESSLGKTKTVEHREKIRNANIGKSLSDETKEKMSQSKLGKSLSEEHKEKLRKPKSEETKEKMRKPKSEEHRENIKKAKNKNKNNI